jgi:hypothetical protein
MHLQIPNTKKVSTHLSTFTRYSSKQKKEEGG